MARTLYRLSAIEIRNARKPGYYADGGNLYLQVTRAVVSGRRKASGVLAVARSWIFRFGVEGRTRDMGIGRYPTITLDRARELAERCRRQVAEGIDPIEARNAERQARRAQAGRGRTFEQCAKAYIAAHEPTWRNRVHRQQWTSTLKTYVYPTIAKLSVAAIDTDLVVKVLEPIWHNKAETASRVRGRIEVILDWARVAGLREGENPARWRGHLDKLLPAPGKVRAVAHHAALPYAKVPDFVGKLRAREGGMAERALQFGILTALRSREFREAQWDEFDLQANVWIIPGGPKSRMKRQREHRVPLSDAAVALIKDLPRLMQPGADGRREPSPFLFPGQRRGQAISDTAIRDVLRDMGLGKHDASMHGFRSTFRDWCAEQTSFPREIAEAALAHAVGNATEAAYFRSDLFERRRELMQAWGEYCAHAHRLAA